MFIRMKYKYYHGFSRAKKLLDDDPVLPGCVSHRERQELKDRFLKSEINKAEYDELRWGVLKKSRNGEASPIIKMELNHGDMIVMHGEELQKYYEVCVQLVTRRIETLLKPSSTLSSRTTNSGLP